MINLRGGRKMRRLSIFVLAAGFAVTALAADPIVVLPVTFTPLFVAESFPFSAMQGDTEPRLPLYEAEDPEKDVLTSDLGTMSPSLITPDSHTYFQTTLGTLPVTVTRNFPGLGNGFNASWTNQGLLPPDTNMAVGPTQIVQWVNLRLSVMDKNGTPLIGGALGYINGNQIWAGLPAGSVCKISNQGDPLAAYDRIANRWVLSQFAFTLATATNGSSYPAAGSYRQCIAVSTTPDATGTYTLYEYAFGNFPDYGKIGVWPDGYYMTFNNFSFSSATGASTYVNTTYCAFDRIAMLAANAVAAGVCFAQGSSSDGTFFASLPSDFDGTSLPPAGSPNYFVGGDWFSLNNPPYSLHLQKFHADFVTPAASTLTDGLGGPSGSYIMMPIPDVVGSCGDGGGLCVPQPGTTRRLDTLSMRPMYPLKYRNRGGVENLVVTQSIDPPGSAVAGINWMEIRGPGANPPVIRQNGAITPNDGLNRWMGSATTDKQGNIAIGYSVSSATKSPSIRIAGRLNSDIVSRVRGEMEVTVGTGNQTSSSGRWGDYSAMQIDPADDCTFWYTQEYTNSSSGANWASQIIAFKFNSCQ